MNQLAQRPESRWEDGIIASRVCAPAAQNPPVSVTFGVGSERKAFVIYFSYLTARFKEIEKLYRTLVTSRTSTNSIALPESAMGDEVPARPFPFAEHLDLVSSPIEGLSFNADDYIER
jgi:hypothetical protein